MKNNYTIGVIGGGSWATAIVKILQEHNHLNWWLRSQDQQNYITQFKHNPAYLSSAVIDVAKVKLFVNINELIESSDILIVSIK